MTFYGFNIYNFVFSYWVWFGLMYLFLLSYQDIKNKMRVDDRRNWFMMGVSISLYSHVHHSLWYALALIGLIIVISIVYHRLKIVGEADINTFLWIFLGFGIINPYWLAVWFVAFLFVVIVYFVILKALMRLDKEVHAPFYPVLFGTFVIVVFALRIY